jgi:hypothetical protein
MVKKSGTYTYDPGAITLSRLLAVKKKDTQLMVLDAWGMRIPRRNCVNGNWEYLINYVELKSIMQSFMVDQKLGNKMKRHR